MGLFSSVLIHKQLCAARVPGLQLKTLQAKAECPVSRQEKKCCTFLMRAPVTVTSGSGLQFLLNSLGHLLQVAFCLIFHTSNSIPSSSNQRETDL